MRNHPKAEEKLELKMPDVLSVVRFQVANGYANPKEITSTLEKVQWTRQGWGFCVRVDRVKNHRGKDHHYHLCYKNFQSLPRLFLFSIHCELRGNDVWK